MDTFKETFEKITIRKMLADASRLLGRTDLTYLGLPGHRGLDIIELRSILKNAICIANLSKTLDELGPNIAGLPIQPKFICEDMWAYLSQSYPSEPLTADITFLDFNGGGITSKNPFSEEVAGIRAYFAKQAKLTEKAFLLAWTYMPRDSGPEKYEQTLSKILPESDLVLLRSAKGVTFRSIAIRLLLKQSLKEHDMSAAIYQHAQYKRSMNTLLLVFSKGADTNCRLSLRSPNDLLSTYVTRYDGKKPVPDFISLINT